MGALEHDLVVPMANISSPYQLGSKVVVILNTAIRVLELWQKVFAVVNILQY